MEYRKLCSFLKEKTIKVDIDNNREYKCGGIRLNGRGIFVREIKLGADIQKQWVMHRVETNDVVYSTLFADKGAFAIATPECEDLIFSEKFVSFEIIDKSVLPEYLHVIFQTDYLSSQCNEFKTGMAAMSLSHSSKKKVLQLSVPIPDVDLQRKIVEQYREFEAIRMQLDDEAEIIMQSSDLVKKKFLNDVFTGATTISLSQLGEYVNRPVEIEPGIEYKQVTVRLHGNGMILRKMEDGSNIKSKQYSISTNDLVYSKIDVKSGAIAFVPEQLSGGVVTSDFPVIKMKELAAYDRDFLMMYFSSSIFSDLMEEQSKGTTNRVRAKKSQFLDTIVPWGDEKYRSEAVEKYSNLCSAHNELISQATSIIADIPVLTSKYLNRLLGIAG